jgi:hypothetical protein
MLQSLHKPDLPGVKAIGVFHIGHQFLQTPPLLNIQAIAFGFFVCPRIDHIDGGPDRPLVQIQVVIVLKRKLDGL